MMSPKFVISCGERTCQSACAPGNYKDRLRDQHSASPNITT